MTANEQRSIDEAMRKWTDVEVRAGARSPWKRWLQACPLPLRVLVEGNPITRWARRRGEPESVQAIEEQAAMWFAILTRPEGVGRYTNNLSRWMDRSALHAQMIRGMFELEALFEQQIATEAARWFELFDRRLDRRGDRLAFWRWCRLSRVHVAMFMDITILSGELDLVGRSGLIDIEALLKR